MRKITLSVAALLAGGLAAPAWAESGTAEICVASVFDEGEPGGVTTGR